MSWGFFIFKVKREKWRMATDVELEKLQREDHDLLLKLHGKLDTLITLQQTAGADLADHEARIRALDKDNTDLKGTVRGVKWALGGIGALIGVVEPFILFYLSKN